MENLMGLVRGGISLVAILGISFDNLGSRIIVLAAKPCLGRMSFPEFIPKNVWNTENGGGLLRASGKICGALGGINFPTFYYRFRRVFPQL